MTITRVVGIGTSAGGLAALTDLVSQLTAGGRQAYVVAQHLDPDHHSHLLELLARTSRLPVVLARDGAPLQPDVIAIVPPNHDVTVVANRLSLQAPAPRYGPAPSIDLLLASIAREWGANGVAVVLSGTGSDGAFGLRSVKEAGGLTLAQSPAEAKFGAMPRAAITLGGAVLVLEAGAIGQHLAGLNSLTPAAAEEAPAPGSGLPATPIGLSALIEPLQRATGLDASHYTEAALRRQVERRMATHQLSDLEAYMPLLEGDPEEAQALAQTLLASGTSFFRDPQAFSALRRLLLDGLSRRPAPHFLRVWVPGCASGEEAYSIAMLISELLGHPHDLAAQLKIFATDLSEQSLSIARLGVYPDAAVAGIPAELRQRFLMDRGAEHVICESLRTCMVFARHDMGKDPPFPRLDLIACRNTLIDFTAPVQERVLALFSFALVPGGLLFLGHADALGSRISGFHVADGEQNLYHRSGDTLARQPLPPGPAAGRQGLAAAPTRSITVLRETIPEQHMALLEVLIRAFCQPSLVLDERHDLVEVIGDITPYCRLPEGRLTTAAQSFLRPELRSEARALFLLTPAVNTTARSTAVHLEDLDQWVRLELRCLTVDGRSILLLSFVPQGEKEAGLTTTAPPGERDAAFDREIQRLERELLSSQETLQRSLMELEQANADLESFSEELQASSEELQSSNEELEASNEEMQVTNQELATLNQTLSCRGEQLERLNADLENIQSSLSQGMVIVDRQLCVTRFTPLAVRVFALMASDLGKPLLRIPTTLPLPQLPEALEAVLQGEPRQSLEASSEDVSYLIQVLPYQDLEGRRRGAIVTLTDVSELMEMSRAAEAALNEFSSLTDALDAVVWKWNQGMSELLYVSQRIHSLTGWSPAELCEHPERFVKAIVPDDRGRVEAARDWTQGRWTVRYRLTTRSGRPLWVVEAGRVVKDGDDRFVVGTLTEVTPGLGLGERAEAA
ncbi:chemotaxis protein CheB [Synechococcus sp. CCY9202]|uniref:chemotaxis protein CheB n=1 Tax=Synechococcus sp. CCY9202 TaxID=174698 RepID=UPI002B2098FA|nr:chemotaxis protein CheB [Synechococcus sp. CCY9202]MEA5422746.1 chemotaxis protein CheB [Synechococcus sp. CCY9202]